MSEHDYANTVGCGCGLVLFFGLVAMTTVVVALVWRAMA